MRESLERLSTGQAKVRLLHVGAGSINESDVLLAIASGATIIGFNAPVEAGARALAAGEGVELRSYTVIYTLVEEMGKALEGIPGAGGAGGDGGARGGAGGVHGGAARGEGGGDVCDGRAGDARVAVRVVRGGDGCARGRLGA